MGFSTLTNFQQRFLMSFLGITLLAMVIFLSHTPPFQYLFIASVAVIQALALSEYYRLSRERGFLPQQKFAILVSIVYIFAHYLVGDARPFLFVLLFGAFVLHFANAESSIANLGITIFGFVYITIPLELIVDINFLGASSWLVYLLITTKMTDTAAYIAGKLWGNHLLAPTLSPKKTMEGAIAGLVGSVAVSFAFFAFFDAVGTFETLHLSWTQALLLGGSIGVIAQIGDLAESLLKRDAQVKDSSTLPGFGGMLDVVDSLLFTTPLLYFWLKAKHIL